MSQTDAVLTEVKDGVFWITINRPEVRNALNPQAIVQLSEAWERYRKDDQLRTAIVTGAGREAFCAGADLASLIPLMTGARDPQDEWDRRVQGDQTASTNAILRDAPLYKPVIAAINGHAIAGGMELVQSCDIRIAVESATLGLQEVKWAIFPMGGSTAKLPRQIPFCRAMEILLTGERISAEEAQRIGLINRVVPDHETLISEVSRFGQIIANNGPFAVRKVKESVLKGSGLPLQDALKLELEMAIPVFMSADAREGPRAFKEKRKPNYKGR